MTIRGLALVWCAALGLVTAAVAVLVERDRSPGFVFMPRVPVMVIGSSVMTFAVPPVGSGSGSLLGNGQAHVRLAINGITEAQTVALAGMALDAGAETVFVEANALAFDFAYRVAAADQVGIWPIVAMEWLLDLSTRARRQLRALFLPLSVLSPEAQGLDRGFGVSQKSLTEFYPLRLRSPNNSKALENLRKAAAARGVNLILIAPPRSQLAAETMGVQTTEALRQHFEVLAHRLDLPLFQPAPFWTNDYFVDQAHLNSRGRARFTRELALWWAHRQ